MGSFSSKNAISTLQFGGIWKRLAHYSGINPVLHEEDIMSGATRLMAGLIFITVPTIQYGGYFLLTSLMDRNSGYMENALRQNFFRAGHAHAGVIVILSLLAQIFVDAAVLPESIKWMIRIGAPVSAILISAGFFFSVLSATAMTP